MVEPQLHIYENAFVLGILSTSQWTLVDRGAGGGQGVS